MRTFSDWRDLPPVPRLGGTSAKPTSEITITPCTDNTLEKRPPLIDSVTDSEEEIVIPRKRRREKRERPVLHPLKRELSLEEGPDKPEAGHGLLKCTNGNQHTSKDRAASPVSGTTVDVTDESSDEEAVLRVRRRWKRVRNGHSRSQERSSSKGMSARRHRGSSNDRRGSSTESRKRVRSSSPGRDLGEGRRMLKRYRRSDRRNGQVAFEEALLVESSPVSESDRSRERTSSGGRRRRCGRQSSGSVTVPWYLLDEERKPRRLRSSSNSCTAGCVYWTRTEHRLFYIAKSPIHNRGLYASEDIPAFVPVIEYAGEVITQIQSEIREWGYQSRHMDEVYMYQLRKGTTNVIDGTCRGGPAKFVNHSCEPNVVADEILAGGTNRVWFFSLRPIRKHEEILVDYCLGYEPGDVKRPCKCGARTCRKFLNYYGMTK